MNNSFFNKYKVLVYSCLVFAWAVSGYFSNYAMVYRMTSMILSSLAVLMVLASFCYLIFSAHGFRNRFIYFLFNWGCLFLYSMNRIALIAYTLVFFLVNNYFKQSDPVPFEDISGIRKRWVYLLPDICMLSLGFLVTDISREWSVWKKAVFNPLPLVAFISVLFLYLIVRIRRRTEPNGK